MPYQLTVPIEISSKTAWDILVTEPNAYLIDVRTEGEWYLGIPDLSSLDKNTIELSWRLYPEMQINNYFISKLTNILKNSDLLLFICKSGARSHEAALGMINIGYLNSYNIVSGFEGWIESNLPWRLKHG